MSYGFPTDDAPIADTAPATTGIKLPPVRKRQVEAAAPAADMARVLQAGQELGFVHRDSSARRKPARTRSGVIA